MLKKFLCFVLCIMLTVTSHGVFAVDLGSASKIPAVYFNDELVAEAGAYFNFIDRYIQYVPIAQIAGYTTTYDDATRTVTSVKNGTTISFVLDSDIITKTENGMVQEIKQQTTTWDGRAYLNDYAIDALFGYGVILPDYRKGIYLYDKDLLAQEFTDSAGNLKNAMEAIHFPSAFSVHANATLNFDSDFSLFGIKIDGSSTLTADFQRQGDAFAGQFVLDCDGLMNLFQLEMYPAIGRSIAELNDEVDLENPVVFRFYTKDDYFYLENGPLAQTILKYTLPFYVSDEFLPELFSSLEGKWIRFEMTSQQKKDVQQFLSGLNDPTTYSETYVPVMIQSMLDDYRFQGKIKNSLDSILNVTSQEHLAVSQSEGITSINWTLPEESLNSWLYGSNFSEEFKDVLLSDFDLNITQNSDLSANAAVKLQTEITQIPNSFHLTFGKTRLGLTAGAVMTPGPQTLNVPEESSYIDYSALYLEAQKYQSLPWIPW